MFLNKSHLRLDFQNDFIINYKICKKVMRKDNIFIFNFIFLFSLVKYISALKLILDSILIYNFQETLSKDSMYLHTNSYYLVTLFLKRIIL